MQKPMKKTIIDDQTYYAIPDAAQFLNCSQQTVRRAIFSHQLEVLERIADEEPYLITENSLNKFKENINMHRKGSNLSSGSRYSGKGSKPTWTAEELSGLKKCLSHSAIGIYKKAAELKAGKK